MSGQTSYVHYLGSRDMGPPSSFGTDFSAAPRPIEVAVNSSRTLPSPAASSPASWENFSSPGFGGYSDYGPARPLAVDNQVRTSAPDPLQQWYTGNDGPWIPKGISTVPEERQIHSSARAGNRIPMPYGNQCRQPNPSDTGSLHYGVAPSDSGYGTRHSDGSASVFSADINDRDQDCQSLVGHVAEYQPFQGLNNNEVALQQRDTRPNEPWPPVPGSFPSNTPSLVCPTCRKPVKTRSELKKHDLRHRKPFLCKYPGCKRTEGFSTTNDLDRHTKSKHPSTMAQSEPTKKYRCHVQGCKSKDKSWPRLDNFRSHLKRVHGEAVQTEDDFEELIRRAEFWERTGPVISQNIGQSVLYPQSSSLDNDPRTRGPFAQIAPIKAGNMEPNLKSMPVYPQVIEPTQELLAPKAIMLEEHNDVPTSDSNASASTVQPRETVQPQEVFRPLQGVIAPHNTPLSLESILLTPVGDTESANRNADQANTRPAMHTSKVSVQGTATKMKDESASDATIMEAIITALVGAEVNESSKDCSMPHQEFEQGSLHHGKSSSGGSWTTGQLPPKAFLKTPNGHDNNASSPAAQDEAKFLKQKKAREVLKTLHELGYIVQKDPSYSPRPHNPGSAASNKSDNLVTCEKCKRFTGRPCELKKHMKRHSRPYGCTFSTCNKSFGSKNDWKRHENSQHFHIETWLCDAEKVEGGTCAKVCYRLQSFQDHLKKDHDIFNAEVLRTKLDVCHIGRNCQDRFWCGFCTKLIELTKKGVEAWTERFNHIDDHFMGRHGLIKQGTQDWVPMDSDKPRGDVELPLDVSPREDGSQDSPSDRSSSGSPNGTLPEASRATGESPARAIDVEENRKRRASDDDSRPAKHPRTALKTETTVYCCQCGGLHNPKLDIRCNFCEEHHLFCASCKYIIRPAGQDESPMS